ncbi:MAG: hypothetical protein LBP22_02915 [Deltaproteobacteria bacterium]|jgi:diacylglycerol kinase family enzyme|nr:hypothetical protein [Deltaproteobacteria bacterium]
MNSLHSKKHIFIISQDLLKAGVDIDKFISNTEGVFLKIGLPDPYFHISRFPRDALATIRRFKDECPETIIRIYAVGGDSILFDCLNAIIDLKDTELASVPLGQYAGFIRAFGDGKNQLFRDIELQATSQVIMTDAILCGSVYALNFCTIGLESYVTYRVNKFAERFKNINCFLPPMLGRAFNRFQICLAQLTAIANSTLLNQRYEVLVDGESHSGSYSCINIANGPCSSDSKCSAVCATPDDGLLDVLLVKSCSPAKFYGMYGNYNRGRYHKYPKYIKYLKAREVSISSEDPLVMQFDGEVFVDKEIKLKIAPAAVNFVAASNLPYHRRASLGRFGSLGRINL